MKDKITEIADALAKVIRNIKSFSDDDRDQVSKLLQDELTIAPDNISDDYKNKKWVTKNLCDRIIVDLFFTGPLVPRNSQDQHSKSVWEDFPDNEMEDLR